jgi:precorrin-6A/cobalt-precorrin-6A reductase
MKRLLILGGTTDATALSSIALAQAAQRPDLEIITSLAGRTQKATAPGTHRIGGFGGAAGLADYLRDQRIDYLIDATHPFANQITWNGAIAAQSLPIPHLILNRPAWEKQEGDRWLEVDSHLAAAAALPDLAQRVFLTIGRQELAAFSELKNIWFLMRMIDPPAPPIPNGEILLDRGPFSLENERNLIKEFNIQAIVSKNSGGDATYAKIIAAREMDIPIVMVQRPPLPEAEIVPTVEQALQWLRDR